jgi:hypothetical protein
MSRDRIDDALRELVESGELRGLPGEGRPFGPDPDADAGDEWASRHLVRTAQVRPVWVDLRGEIAVARARIVLRLRMHRTWLERREALLSRLPAERILAERLATEETDARVRRDIGTSIDDVNVLIRRHNLIVTAPSLHLPIASLDRLLESARQR